MDARTPKTYFLKYKLLDVNGSLIREGKTKAKGMCTEFEACAKFEDHCKKTVPNFHKLQVTQITQDTFLGEIPSNSNDISGMFDAFMKGFK